MHFEWLFNTQHGADYFRRWHRDKHNSGELLVHKSTHHFDLVNFWLGSEPQTVYAQGDLRFYGRANAEQRGVTEFYARCHQSPILRALYLEAEHDDGYYRDKSVFDDGISIEDVLGVMVRYKNRAIMTYPLNAYLPWEGLNVVFNGSRGRLEMKLVEKSYVNGGDDQVILNDLFGAPADDPLQRAAGFLDGALSIMTGIAANRSLRTEAPVNISTLAITLPD